TDADQADDWPRVAAALGVDVEHLVRVRQVHGRDVVVVRAGHATPLRDEASPEADALVSDDPQCAIVVRVADRVPVLLGDRRTGGVGAVHVGGRGTAAGAVPAAIERMRREFGTRAMDLVAAVGPSIGPCCYEVGPELIDAFAAHGHRRERLDRWFTPYPN